MANFKPKTTPAVSRDFLAAARLSCFLGELMMCGTVSMISQWQLHHWILSSQQQSLKT